MAASERNLSCPVAVTQEEIDEAAVELQAARLAAVAEDLYELLDARALGEHFVMNPPEECLIDERRGSQVRREDQQRGKWQLELLTGLQGEEVDAAFERHDPAVEKLTRLDLLASEVVDDQHAAIRHGLHRRLIEAGRRAVAQLERIERQLATDDDERASAAHPSPIGRHI